MKKISEEDLNYIADYYAIDDLIKAKTVTVKNKKGKVFQRHLKKEAKKKEIKKKPKIRDGYISVPRYTDGKYGSCINRGMVFDTPKEAVWFDTDYWIMAQDTPPKEAIKDIAKWYETTPKTIVNLLKKKKGGFDWKIPKV